MTKAGKGSQQGVIFYESSDGHRMSFESSCLTSGEAPTQGQKVYYSRETQKWIGEVALMARERIRKAKTPVQAAVSDAGPA